MPSVTLNGNATANNPSTKTLDGNAQSVPLLSVNLTGDTTAVPPLDITLTGNATAIHAVELDGNAKAVVGDTLLITLDGDASAVLPPPIPPLLFPCSNALKECLPCNDFPIANFSSEGVDAQFYIGINNFILFPPLGDTFTKLGCKTLCVSTVSQADADACAARQAEECVLSTGKLPTNPPVSVPIYYNLQASCTVKCNGGQTFTWRVAPGTYVALSQLSADRIAASVACNLANRNKICIQTSELPQACFGQGYSQLLKATGGHPLFFPYAGVPSTPPEMRFCGHDFQPVDYIWELASGILPPGMELDMCTGEIFGQAAADGEFTFVVKVFDGIGSFQVQELTLCVVKISPDALPDPTPNTPYSHFVTASSCSEADLEWSVVSGELPDGLSLNPISGLISGTPTKLGAFQFTVNVKTDQ